MAETKTARQRPGTMRLADAITGYRYPPMAIVSILHRGSGMVMFFLLPFIVWLFDTSLTSEVSYDRFASLFQAGVAGVPGWFFKLVALALIWSYLHHFIAGVRHLWMDATHSVGLQFGRQSAQFTNWDALLLTVILGIKLFFF
jgi:succinate dehydrogenase / fumarate reductase cytochrome b subunit